MINPDNVKAGDTLYDVHSRRMGNTTMRTMGCWPVEVLEVLPPPEGVASQLPRFRVRWNHNAPTLYSWSQIRKLRRSPLKEKV